MKTCSFRLQHPYKYVNAINLFLSNLFKQNKEMSVYQVYLVCNILKWNF